MKSRKNNADADQQRREAPRKMYGIDVQVSTIDGIGRIIGYDQRRNTNGGPGCKQYVVRLSDGRVRRYGHVDQYLTTEPKFVGKIPPLTEQLTPKRDPKMNTPKAETESQAEIEGITVANDSSRATQVDFIEDLTKLKPILGSTLHQKWMTAIDIYLDMRKRDSSRHWEAGQQDVRVQKCIREVYPYPEWMKPVINAQTIWWRSDQLSPWETEAYAQLNSLSDEYHARAKAFGKWAVKFEDEGLDNMEDLQERVQMFIQKAKEESMPLPVAEEQDFKDLTPSVINDHGSICLFSSPKHDGDIVVAVGCNKPGKLRVVAQMTSEEAVRFAKDILISQKMTVVEAVRFARELYTSLNKDQDPECVDLLYKLKVQKDLDTQEGNQGRP